MKQEDSSVLSLLSPNSHKLCSSGRGGQLRRALIIPRSAIVVGYCSTQDNAPFTHLQLRPSSLLKYNMTQETVLVVYKSTQILHSSKALFLQNGAKYIVFTKAALYQLHQPAPQLLNWTNTAMSSATYKLAFYLNLIQMCLWHLKVFNFFFPQIITL